MDILEQNYTLLSLQYLMKDREGKRKNREKISIYSKLICRNITNEFSSCIPRAIFKGLSNHTASFNHSPIIGAIIRKVFQEAFASQFIDSMKEEVPQQVLQDGRKGQKTRLVIGADFINKNFIILYLCGRLPN